MKNRNILLPGFLLLGLAAFGAITQDALAQRLDKYIVTTPTLTWTDISGTGTNIFNGDITGYSGVLPYRSNTTTTMPFAFNYDNTTVAQGTTLYISGAAISIGTAYTANNISAGGLGNGSYPALLCLFAGTRTGIGGRFWSDNGIWTQVTGVAPNRVYTMQMNHVHSACAPRDQGGSAAGCSVQIKIFETGVIQFIYQTHGTTIGGDCGSYYWGSVGLNGYTSPSFISLTEQSNVSTSPSTDYQFSPVPPAQLSLQPKSLNFGALPAGLSDTLTVTATSVGTSPLHITSYSLTGTPNFQLVSGPGAGTTIQPNNSVQYTFAFHPNSSSGYSGVFTLVTDGKDSGTQVVNLSGNGLAPVISYQTTELFRRIFVMLSDTSATQYIHFTNSGTYPLQFNSAYTIGLNAADYFITSVPTAPIPPDGMDSVGVRFAPRLEGRPDAKVVISTDAANIPQDTIPLYGIGTLPHLVITVPAPGSGNTVMFDSVAIGDSVCQTVQLTNTGTDTLQILKQLVTYGDYDFTYYPLTGTDTTILPGGATKFVDVCFKPLKFGTRLATLRIFTNIPRTFKKPSRDTGEFDVSVTGIGVPYGELGLAGSISDTAEVGKTNCITDTLENFGQSQLTLTGVKITGPNSSAFTITGATPPVALAAGGMQIVTICYQASARGSQYDTLFLTGSTSEKSVADTIILQGVGVQACVSADAMISFGMDSMTMVGASDTNCITVTNCGDIATTYTATAPTGSGYSLEPPMTSAVIPAGGTAQFCVVFTPSSVGAASGSIQISGGPNPTTTILNGVGAGVLAVGSGTDTKPVAIGSCDTFAVTITDNGNVPWTPGTGSIGGTNASDFTIVGGPTPALIPANGGTATVMIQFCASQNGTESMTLTFPSSSPTPVQNFSYSATAIGSSAGVTMRTEQDGFSLGASYPNPTTGSADLMVTLPYQAPVRIDLIDATGAFVKTAFQGQLAGGSQMITLNAKGLPSGTYFYQLSSGDVRLTRQMSLIK